MDEGVAGGPLSSADSVKPSWFSVYSMFFLQLLGPELERLRRFMLIETCTSTDRVLFRGVLWWPHWPSPPCPSSPGVMPWQPQPLRASQPCPRSSPPTRFKFCPDSGLN